MSEVLGCTNDDMASDMSYRELFASHTDNVSDKWENYLEIYDDHYHKFIGKHPNYLEIGVQNGGSLQITDKYFINANIYGIDINTDVCHMKFAPNIKTYCFDISDTASIKRYFANIEFDVILDDGSHRSPHVIGAFKTLFPQLKPGGVYLIEDLCTSYWPTYEGGYLAKDSSIEFFKGFIDLLNSYHINMVDNNFIQDLSEDSLYIFKWLKSITFYDNVVAIDKLIMPRYEPYKRVFTGTVEQVVEVKHLGARFVTEEKADL